MIPRPPRSTRTDTLLRYTTPCRSAVGADDRDLGRRQELQMDIIENGLARAREGLGQTLHHIGVLDGHRRETSSRFRGCGKVAAHLALGRCVGKPAPVRYAFALGPMIGRA